ncbi:MAG: multiple sugar transport system substrate-binding protein [Thermomicrobiales bacterium]|nr:multiple sugar transport system substrate-binding protein [Thermomicrobiales bacterium]
MPRTLPAPFRPRRWSRVVLVVLVIASTIFSLVGVRGSSAQDRQTVSFAFWGDPAEQKAYEQVVAEFEAANPTIDVEMIYTPGQSDYTKKIATSFAGGAPPDLFLINYRSFGQYAARDALHPIAEYLSASPTIRVEDYYQTPLEAFQYRGESQTCMPQNASSLVVYYNVDLFRQNHVALPHAEWTWDQFVATAKALTQDTDGDGQTDQYGVVVDPQMYRFVSFIWSNGGEIVDNVDNPTTLTLDTPEAVEAIEDFVHLGVSGAGVVPSEAEVQAEDDQARFMRGGAAMYLQSRREVPTLREIEGFTWDVAPLPVQDVPATVLHSDAFCMAEATTHKDAAWKFVEFAVGQRGQTILAATGRIVPILKSVAQSDAFLKGTLDGAASALPPASSQVFLDNLAYVHRLPSVSTWPEVEDAFNVEFRNAFYQRIDIPEAIERATAASRDAFKRAQDEESS